MGLLKGRELHAGLVLGAAIVVGLLLLQARRQPHPSERRGTQARGTAAPSDVPVAPRSDSPPEGAPPSEPRGRPAAPGDDGGGTPAPGHDRPLASPLEGTVYGDDAPAAAAEVEIAGIEGRARTDEQGRFRFDSVPHGCRLLIARSGEEWGSVIADVPVEEPVTIRLSPGGPTAVTGEVRRNGEAVAAASVRLWVVRPQGGAEARAEAITDGGGQFAIEGLVPRSYGLQARGPTGDLSRVAQVSIGPGERPHVRLDLMPRAAISGRVTDEDAAPVAGAAVWVRPDGAEAMLFENETAAVTGADGSFRIDGLLEGGRYVFSVWWAGRPSILTVVAPAADIEIRVRLMTPLIVHVVDAAGAPVPDAYVEVIRESRTGFESHGTSHGPGEDGPFTFEGLDPGAYMVRARAPGHGDGEAGPVILAGGRSPVEVTVVLGAPITVSGRVVGPDGLPVAGARVTALDERSRYLARFRRSVLGELPDSGGGTGITGPDGRFSLACGGAASWTLMAEHDGYPPAMVDVDVPASGASGIGIRLSRGGTIAGVVVGGQRGTILACTPGEEEPETCEAEVSDDGRFRMDGLVPGTYALLYCPPSGDSEQRREPVVVEAGGETWVEFLLEERIAVCGLVLSGEQPVEGASVRLSPTEPGGSEVDAGTDALGRFVLEAVRRGTYEIWVFVGDPQGSRSEVPVLDRIDLTAARDDLVFRLPAARIAGRVVDARTGEGVGGVRVYALSTADLGSGFVATSADGTFVIGPLHPGDHTVEVIHDAFRSEQHATAREGLTPEGPDAVVLQIEQGVVVTGTVRDRRGNPVGNADITFVDAEGVAVSGERPISTEADGLFSATIAPGVYDVYCRAAGFAEARLPHQAVTGPAELSFALDAPGVLFLRVVRADGVSVGRATIEIPYPDGGRFGGGRALWTSERGEMIEDGIGPGRYRIRAAAPDGGATGEAVADIVAGEMTTVEITLR